MKHQAQAPAKPPRRQPMSGPERQRNYITRFRQRLIAMLGGKCANPECGSIIDLEFDHLEPRTWKNRDYWSGARLKILEQEIEAGKIQLLCGPCNKAKGPPDDGVEF